MGFNLRRLSQHCYSNAHLKKHTVRDIKGLLIKKREREEKCRYCIIAGKVRRGARPPCCSERGTVCWAVDAEVALSMRRGAQRGPRGLPSLTCCRGPCQCLQLPALRVDAVPRGARRGRGKSNRRLPSLPGSVFHDIRVTSREKKQKFIGLINPLSFHVDWRSPNEKFKFYDVAKWHCTKNQLPKVSRVVLKPTRFEHFCLLHLFLKSKLVMLLTTTHNWLR